MKKKFILPLILTSLAPFHTAITAPISDKIKSSLYSSAIGDALGRVTEFINTTDKIFQKYPQGVRTFDDFKKSDWQNLPQPFSSSTSAPYTDDTRMALIVTDVLISSRKNSWDLEKTMGEIAQAFAKDLDDLTYGWGASYRAPGNACLTGVNIIKGKLNCRCPLRPGWWNTKSNTAGGCGSVMRAFPFGLIFSDDPTKAKTWAVEHSKITHGDPIALAACAAMATGVAHALQGDLDHNQIITTMIEAAQEYDKTTADKMSSAYTYAQQARKLLDALGTTEESASSIEHALTQKEFRALHDKVFNEFPGWAAHDAIAATVYVFALYRDNCSAGLYVGVHTSGDSDSIAAMSGALIGAYSGSLPNKKLIDSIEDTQRIASIGAQINQFNPQ